MVHTQQLPTLKMVTYTETSQSFQFDKGTIGNTNYIAIAANSGNVAGAQVAINEMLDPEVQADRFHRDPLPSRL